jgi:HK97 family phage prohead protease
MPDLHGPFVLDVGLPTVKSLEDDDGDILIAGYAADFEVDRQGEKFLAGAFDEACKAATEGKIPLLLEHNNNQPLGVVEVLRPDDRGLYVEGRIAAKAVSDAWDGAKGKVEMIRRGVMKGLSVRGHSWGRMGPDGPEIGKIDLAEISVTPVPVQPGALFTVTKKAMDYAVDPTAAPDLDWASGSLENTVGLLDQYSKEEIASAIDTYFKGRIKDLRTRLKACKDLLDKAAA